MPPFFMRAIFSSKDRLADSPKCPALDLLPLLPLDLLTELLLLPPRESRALPLLLLLLLLLGLAS